VVYKYGASDAAFHPLGGMPFLFWHVIRDARASGCLTLDLGRTSAAQQGLLTFKDRLGATRSPLGYWQLPAHEGAASPFRAAAARVARQVMERTPGGLHAATGRLLYRHVG
jgi:lipid II:glycine glycyltransferase (peptidoglycan interpeptide bridge formation enzyme)